MNLSSTSTPVGDRGPRALGCSRLPTGPQHFLRDSIHKSDAAVRLLAVHVDSLPCMSGSPLAFPPASQARRGLLLPRRLVGASVACVSHAAPSACALHAVLTTAPQHAVPASQVFLSARGAGSQSSGRSHAPLSAAHSSPGPADPLLSSLWFHLGTALIAVLCWGPCLAVPSVSPTSSGNAQPSVLGAASDLQPSLQGAPHFGTNRQA